MDREDAVIASETLWLMQRISAVNTYSPTDSCGRKIGASAGALILSSEQVSELAKTVGNFNALVGAPSPAAIQN